MKVLILKPSSLGDVIQALPVLRLLKRRFPEGEFYWWVESGLAPLLEGDRDLTGIIRFERRHWARPKNWAKLWRDVRWTRAQNFDWVIDLQCLARSAIFAWLANGQFTIGLDEPREGARGFYDAVVRRNSFETHAVDWYLAVVERLGIPVQWDFEWLPLRPKVLAGIRSKWPIDSARWVILQPGARWLNKRWPVESFKQVVQQWPVSAGNFRFAILGGQEDQELGAALATAAPQRCLDLTGQVTLPEMLEWIRSSELMITNDTGPMHAAAAMGRPVIGLFGPTEPRRTGPYGQLNNVLQNGLSCVPCLRSRCHYSQPLECLRGLPASRVLARVNTQFGLNGNG